MSYLESLKWRYATKKFDPNRTLAPDVLDRLLEAAGLTATSFGLQAIKILNVATLEKREALLPYCFNQRQVVDASDLLVLCVDTDIDAQKVENYISLVAKTRNQPEADLDGFKNAISGYVKHFPSKEPLQEWLARQAYITLGTMLTACALERVDSCPMEGFKAKEIADELGLEAMGLFPVLLLPVGYRSESDKNQHLPKVRKPKEDYLMTI